MVADSLTKEEAAKVMKQVESQSNDKTEPQVEMFRHFVVSLFATAERIDFDEIELEDSEVRELFSQQTA